MSSRLRYATRFEAAFIADLTNGRAVESLVTLRPKR